MRVSTSKMLLLTLLVLIVITIAIIWVIKAVKRNNIKRYQLERIKKTSTLSRDIEDSRVSITRKNDRADTKYKNHNQSFFVAGRVSDLLENSLFTLGLRVNVYVFVVIWMVLVLGLPALIVLLTGSVMGAIVTLIVLISTPFVIMYVLQKRRTALFEDQLTDAIDVMKSAMKAGHSFQDSLSVVAQSSDDPIRTEFQILFDEISLGSHITDAISNMKKRINSAEVEIFCSALLMQITTGGNLIIVLENIADTIRTRVRLKKDIKSKTAAGRLSGVIVGIMPFALVVFIKATTPNYFDDFIAMPLGKTLIAVCLTMMGIGILIIRRITNIKY